MNSSFDPEELTKETSLFRVWLGARSIPVNRFNQFVSALTFAALTTYVVITNQPTSSIASQVYEIAGIGFSYAGTMLGFLIAGFTLSMTFGKPDYFVAMAKHINPESNLSYLKDYTFSFMKVFISYLWFTGFCLLILVFANKNGAIEQISNILSEPTSTREWFIKIVFVLLCGSFVHLLLILKSFIYNIYISVMNAIRYQIEQEQGRI